MEEDEKLPVTLTWCSYCKMYHLQCEHGFDYGSSNDIRLVLALAETQGLEIVPKVG